MTFITFYQKYHVIRKCKCYSVNEVANSYHPLVLNCHKLTKANSISLPVTHSMDDACAEAEI